MNVQINLLAVVLAAASSLVVGGIWYAKPVFGSTWEKLVGLSDKEIKRGAMQAMVVAAVAGLMTAYVLAYFTYMTNRYFSTSYEFWMTDALQTAFMLWLGLSAATIVVHNAFEQKRARLTALAVSNQFVCLMVMGVMIGLFKP